MPDNREEETKIHSSEGVCSHSGRMPASADSFHTKIQKGWRENAKSLHMLYSHRSTMSKLEAARRRGEVKEAHQVQTTEPGHRHKPKEPKKKPKSLNAEQNKKKENKTTKRRTEKTHWEQTERDVEDGLQMGTIF